MKHTLFAALMLGAAPVAAQDVPLHRLSVMGFWHPVTGQAATQSLWTGAAYAYGVVPGLVYAVVGGGYAAVGERPGDGRDVIGVAGGLELQWPLEFGTSVFGRALAGANIPVGGEDRVPIGVRSSAGDSGSPDTTAPPPEPMPIHGAGPLGTLERWDVEPLLLSFQFGARFGVAEVYGAAGMGPAGGVNIGFGVAFSLSL